MKYIALPLNLIRFWYPESIVFFAKVWKNLMLFLEEDLAAGLMWKLLFTPLFHDSSVVGRVLSFIFRLARIFVGIFAFFMTTVVLFAIGGYWLILPALAIFDMPAIVSRVLFLSGLGLFIINIIFHPHKKIWQAGKDPDIWTISEVKEEDLNFKKLLADPEVISFLLSLEIKVNNFPSFEIADKEAVAGKAFELGKICSSDHLRSVHFFVSALSQMPNIDQNLAKLGLELSDFEKALMYLEKKRKTWRRVYFWDDDFTVRHLKGVNRGWLGVPTPNLDLIGVDLTKEAISKGFHDVVRENGVLKEIVDVLSQEGGRNVILVGPAGCGKTATLRHLAKQIVAGDAPLSLATKRIVLLDLTKLLSGVKTQGELAEKIKIIFEEVGFAQNVIIAIEEIHELGMGEAGESMNLYSLMHPYIESDTFQFIGTTETENYTKILEKNSSFARMFRKVEMSPATEKDTLDILEYRAIEAERKNKVKITFVALKTAVTVSQKFIQDRVLPDSAISVFKEALTGSVNGWVTKDVVKSIVSSRVKVPLMEVGNIDKNKLLNLEEEIHTRLIDQEQAVKAVADALRRSATGLRDEGRPIGSFLFVGPTGVGKTELAKILSGIYFQTSGAFIRFDMSEYQNSESVNRLIGGAGQEGQLTEAVRQRPYSLLLLDEFEKADPKILTLFLQVLEDGRLTNAGGKTVDFTNTIIIATSNAGSLAIAQGLASGKDLGQISQEVNEELLKVFKPELVNRFDSVVLFKPLSSEDLQKIVKIKLAFLQKQMKEKGYLVEFDEALVREFAKRGFDPVLGARPLRRLLQDTLEAKLSTLILQNHLQKGVPFKAGIELMSY
ncbi:MAG: hypothetical protein ACD_38C00047G0016 [uncultured bacterium]|uniref:ATPase with chaperone activity, ATP-binding subunit n=2 Tax=Microgenomates group TaxID=1794810 RepID=A0A0G0TV96_9BACT|nr:MAG: hypothetical protein ACD_38C00047G0016 [uncultured bacterium]KKQ75800.1 MAG: ATPase with chaperone activity, ATP-binding subunit [Candidatus Woesebacteria bacterium GW2011_GWB1_38_5b]KKQ81721.1 MAG: ATPase with chaperone activity, ATP-binding subunit [Candidatus Daviesbacteria bacterium GW2011_GWF2_38_7]KKR16567.1 MAG: ATPase with chaperone activity, ATP-binding subunit [Candidatus Daviesbacteria bacterium GW2011_GWA2_39_33]KKR41832.1 MAG: ATPase with chaperone activity, ATP-binding sub